MWTSTLGARRHVTSPETFLSPCMWALTGTLLYTSLPSDNFYGTPKPPAEPSPAAPPLNVSEALLPGARPSAQGKRKRNQSVSNMEQRASLEPPEEEEEESPVVNGNGVAITPGSMRERHIFICHFLTTFVTMRLFYKISYLGRRKYVCPPVQFHACRSHTSYSKLSPEVHRFSITLCNRMHKGTSMSPL